MKKILLYLLAIAVVLLAVGYLISTFFLGKAVTAGVNRFGPAVAHTRVSLGEASLSPLSGSGTLKELVIGNPAGWSEDDALHLGRIHVQVVPTSLMGDHIIVKDVTVEDPVILYQTKFVSSNIGDLLKGLEGAASKGDSSTQVKTKSGKPVKFEVQHLLIKDPKIRLGVGPTAITVPMPSIELKDLGTAEGGITSDQVALAVMRSLSTETLQAAGQAIEKVGGTVGATAAGALKGLFGSKK